MKDLFPDEMRVTDSRGFHYQILMKHYPQAGVSYAYYHGFKVAVMEYGKFILPQSDSEKEWEEFEQRFWETIGDAVIEYFKTTCKDYFDKHTK